MSEALIPAQGPVDVTVSRQVVETEDWKLGCFMDWRPKHKVIDCPRCNGRGEIGGHFKDLDGARPCDECYGTKIKRVPPTTQPPEIPAALREHMRRAWWDFMQANVK